MYVQLCEAIQIYCVAIATTNLGGGGGGEDNFPAHICVLATLQVNYLMCVHLALLLNVCTPRTAT